MRLKFYSADRKSVVDELNLTREQMDKTGMWDAGVVTRKQRYFRYNGMKDGAGTFVEVLCVSLDRSDI